MEIGVKSYYIKQRENSFHYVGPRLFNKIPRNLHDTRNLSLTEWKYKLDEFLNTIPDNPATSETVPGLCDPSMAKPSNSLIHWIPFLGFSNRRGTMSDSNDTSCI